MSRRRHTIKTPAVCIKVRPPTPPPPYIVPCSCTLAGGPAPDPDWFVVVAAADYPSLPINDQVETYTDSTPTEPWVNPALVLNRAGPMPIGQFYNVPPTARDVVCQFNFTDGHQCWAHATLGI